MCGVTAETVKRAEGNQTTWRANIQSRESNYMAHKRPVEGNQTTWRSTPSRGKSNYMTLNANNRKSNYMARKHRKEKSNYMALNNQHREIKLHGPQHPVEGNQTTPSLDVFFFWGGGGGVILRISELIEINKG